MILSGLRMRGRAWPAAGRSGLTGRSDMGDSRLVVRWNNLHTFGPPPSRAASPGFLQSHQKPERRIFELQMAKHAPVLTNIRLEKLQNVTETDDAGWRDGGAGGEGTEGDDANSRARRELGVTTMQQVIDDPLSFLYGVSKPADDGFQHFAVANAGVDPDAPLLHLADDHVDRSGGDAESRIDIAHVDPLRGSSRNGGSGEASWKTEGENVDVCDGAEAIAAGASDDRIFR